MVTEKAETPDPIPERTVINRVSVSPHHLSKSSQAPLPAPSPAGTASGDHTLETFVTFVPYLKEYGGWIAL